jgi:hypothetical protein
LLRDDHGAPVRWLETDDQTDVFRLPFDIIPWQPNAVRRPHFRVAAVLRELPRREDESPCRTIVGWIAVCFVEGIDDELSLGAYRFVAAAAVEVESPAEPPLRWLACLVVNRLGPKRDDLFRTVLAFIA